MYSKYTLNYKYNKIIYNTLQNTQHVFKILFKIFVFVCIMCVCRESENSSGGVSKRKNV